jgi:hypothetical protein
MFIAYLDESGTDERSPAMCVAGMLYDQKVVSRLDREWKRELGHLSIPYFHTVEYAHLKGTFEGHSRESSDRLYRRLIDLIKRFSCGNMTVFTMPEKEFDACRHGKWAYSQYTTCAYICMSLLLRIARRLDQRDVSFIIERGHARMSELKKLIKEMKDKGWRIGSCEFRGKDECRPLQTADVWAYELAKRLRDRIHSPTRPARKSLMSLVSGIPNKNYTVLDKSDLDMVFDSFFQLMVSPT